MKKQNLNEEISRIKGMIKRLNEGAFVDDDGNLIGFEGEDQKITRFDLFGMTPAQVKESNPNLKINSAEYIEKPIQYAVEFRSTGDFTAIRFAETFIREEGFINGSMNLDLPMLLVRGGADREITTRHGETRAAVITKWDRLSPNEYNQLDGVLVTDEAGFREGNVVALFFNYY